MAEKNKNDKEKKKDKQVKSSKSGLTRKANDLFAFNLLPPKSEEELAELAARAARNFYAGLMPVSVAILGAFLFIANNFLLSANLTAWENSVANLQAQLNNPNNQLGQYKTTNGELKIKTDFIVEAVDKNVNFNEIFTVTDEAFAGNTTNSAPTSYGREDTGEFIVNAVTPREDGPPEILNRFRQVQGVEDAKLKFVQNVPERREYRFTIGFDLSTIENDGIQQAGSQQTTDINQQTGP